MTAPTWPNGRPRSSGNAFDILYRRRRATKATPTPAKPRQGMSAVAKTLRALSDNAGGRG